MLSKIMSYTEYCKYCNDHPLETFWFNDGRIRMDVAFVHTAVGAVAKPYMTKSQYANFEDFISEFKWRLAQYLYFCCIGEARHCFKAVRNNPLWFNNIVDEDPLLKEFRSFCSENSSDYEVRSIGCDRLSTWIATHMDRKDSFKFLEDLFVLSPWGPHFGGLPWGFLTSLLPQLFEETSTEESILLLDKIGHIAHASNYFFSSSKYPDIAYWNLDILDLMDYKKSANLCCLLNCLKMSYADMWNPLSDIIADHFSPCNDDDDVNHHYFVHLHNKKCVQTPAQKAYTEIGKQNLLSRFNTVIANVNARLDSNIYVNYKDVNRMHTTFVSLYKGRRTSQCLNTLEDLTKLKRRALR